MENFKSLLQSQDLKLFEKIHSQTTANDKRSLLGCQKAVREILSEYTYLEIGSYIRGSLKPFVLDKCCKKIISIDKRPKATPDERGFDQTYLNNTTEFMLENLKQPSSNGIE